MKRIIIYILALIGCVPSAISQGATDPVTAAAIAVSTAVSSPLQVSAAAAIEVQQAAFYLDAKFVKDINKMQETYLAYLDSVRYMAAFAAQLYGFWREGELLVKNIKYIKDLKWKFPENALAVAISPSKSGIYVDIGLLAADIVLDVKTALFDKDARMNDRERIDKIMGIRPKFKELNRKLERFAMFLHYTDIESACKEFFNIPMKHRMRTHKDAARKCQVMWETQAMGVK